MHAWSVGDHLTHRFNPELGTGRVTAIEGRVLVVHFPQGDATLRLAAHNDALVHQAAHAPVRERSLLDRLTAGDVDPAEDFLTRLDILHLLEAREASGLGSFLGGRVRLFPHQLHVAERATARMPVRWLLADEVGLGKTIEAALIMNRLLHTQRIERCLVVAPEALTVQWLGELWRKYHQAFTLLDAPRLVDVARDFGAGFNPFDVHRRAVVALETLVERSELTGQAVAAGIDLLVVDEAHRLRRPPGHPGEPAYRAVAPIAAAGRHVLLLSATPLEDDAQGFFRLLQLLRPEEVPEGMDVEARLRSGVPLPPCTSATRRADIGGLPPRVPIPVDLPADSLLKERSRSTPNLQPPTANGPISESFMTSRSSRQMKSAKPGHDCGTQRGAFSEQLGVGSWDLTRAISVSLSKDGGHEPSRRDAYSDRRSLDRIRRGLASGAALKAVLGPEEEELREAAETSDRTDPRLEWLLTHAQRWHRANDKTLVFVAHRETLEMLREALSARAHIASGVFHEALSAARRDTEVARFRADDGPSILVSTEAGGEGRNFEFCHRLVLYDLPWKPWTVEQRIGRLDRIGRRIPVEVVYFRPAAGIGADVVRLFERLGLFREPIAGIELQLTHVERALEEIALDPEPSVSDAQIDQLIADAQAARTRIHEAAYQLLHHDPYNAALGPSILARVPPDLDALMEQVIVNAASGLGYHVEQVRGRRSYAIDLGNGALTDGLPGVPRGSSFVGSFDREFAVEDESIDFFASGHSLVEGLLAHFEEDAKGRVARLEIQAAVEPGTGLIVIYKDGPRFEVVAFDADGAPRAEWADVFRRRPLAAVKMPPADAAAGDWAALALQAAAQLERRRPHAIAVVLFRAL